MPARRVRTPAEMRQVPRDLLAERVPAVIDYRLAELPSVFRLRFLPRVRRGLRDNPPRPVTCPDWR